MRRVHVDVGVAGLLVGCIVEQALPPGFHETGTWIPAARELPVAPARTVALAVDEDSLAWTRAAACPAAPCPRQVVFRSRSDGPDILLETSSAADTFGDSLAIADGWIAVGSPGADRVDLYRTHDGGQTHVSLRNGDVEGFGAALAMDQGWLAVGIPARLVGDRRGAVAVYRQVGDGWAHTETLETLSRHRASSLDAIRLAMSGARLAVGLPLSDAPAPGPGSVDRPDSGRVELYVLREQRWVLERELPDARIGGTRFAQALALDRRWLAVGTALGQVRLFRRSDERWEERPPLVLRGARQDGFGQAVALFGAQIWVGAPDAAACTPGAARGRSGAEVCDAQARGALYRFTPDADGVWQLDLVIGARPEEGLGSGFGAVLGADQDQVVTGAEGGFVKYTRGRAP